MNEAKFNLLFSLFFMIRNGDEKVDGIAGYFDIFVI